MTPAYALPWDFQAKTFDYRETIWGVYQDDDKIFRKSKNAVQQPSRFLEKVTVKTEGGLYLKSGIPAAGKYRGRLNTEGGL